MVFDSYLSLNYEKAVIADLGCGTGRFAIASALLDPSHVICIDVDYEALKVAATYASKFNVEEKIDFIHASIPFLNFARIDVVFQNPPFGVHMKHADLVFLRTALNFKPKIIYSIHKSNEATRNLIVKISSERNYSVKILATKTIVIPPFMKHHFKMKHKVLVDLYKIVKRGNTDNQI